MTTGAAPTAAFTMFVTTDSVQPPELARLVEQRGGEALLFPDHSHVSVAAVEGHPGGTPPK